MPRSVSVLSQRDWANMWLIRMEARGPNMANVTVYAFTAYHIGTDNDDHRPIKATRGTIAKLAGALIIEASAEEVDASLIDGHGFYGRKAKTNGR